MEYALGPRQTLIIAILVLFLGKYLTARIGFLRHYNIPEPVTGGVLASLFFLLVYLVADRVFAFDLRERDVFLVVFFTCIGLSSRISSLLAGGRALLTLLVLAVGLLFLQNLIGVAVVSLAGLDPVVGILGGSISLSGGHGTAIAWASLLEESYGIADAMEIGIACATFGLILGGIVGGPIANLLVTRYRLKSSSHEHITVGVPQGKKDETISVDSVLNAILMISIAIGIGLHLDMLLQHLDINMPLFVSCLFAGILMTNTVPLIFKQMPWPTGTAILALISDLSLGLFLAMSLMSLQLWTLLGLAGPIVLLLAGQVVAVTLYVLFILFPVMGRDYDAAVMSAGYAGLGLGATPTALANMTAVTERHGPSSQAFLVIPLVGAFFIDIANALVVNVMLKLVS
ncbi:sodium/glutamate symporter [Microbulbifer flavimaris]|uniref:Sodium/glutamate symporter n=1 Tax=Microbulbifer flavimaris TaxID=1781068 RepID=A0ABX4HWE9_9GAMM|nr:MULTISPECIES: sodium/glutamate symporter [Microbulbifer]KUJ81509.1 glutamate permease [Microbulbifer sp. ZGT114]PCO04417.1 sodium/glutamate symporter [Microbulbifer flavimaris]